MWPLIIGAITKYAANADAQNRQAKLQQAMRAYQLQQAGGNERAIQGLLDQQTPAARGAELQGIQASRATSMQGAVDAARAASPVTAVAGTNTSQDYQKASAAAADTVADRTKRAIQQMSIMGAPGEQGMKFGMRFGRAAGDVDAGNAAIGNVGNAYMNSIRNTVPNPALSMAGDGLMAYGGATLGTGGAATAQPEQLAGQGSASWDQPDQLSGPGYTAPATAATRRRSAWPAGWGR